MSKRTSRAGNAKGGSRGKSEGAEAAACILEVYIQPGASSTEVAGIHGTVPKIRIAAPPVEGAANKALVEFVAKAVGVPKSAVEIVSGLSSRNKRLRITGAALSAVKIALDIQP